MLDAISDDVTHIIKESPGAVRYWRNGEWYTMEFRDGIVGRA
jgi:hypothetical protein